MPYSWNEIYNQAQRFDKSANLLNQKGGDLLIVSYTNAAFAIELYYKALYLKTFNKNPSKTNHDLKNIFNELPKNIQDEIISDYRLQLNKRGDLSNVITDLKKITPDFTPDFLWNLEQVKHAFLNFRYVYEKGKQASIVFYPELKISVINQLEK
jgi:hypothetical protein